VALVSAWRRMVTLVRHSLQTFESERADRRPIPRRLTVVLERDDLDGGWVAECLELPGCVAQGETEKEAVSNIVDAIGAVITVRMEQQLDSASSVTVSGNTRRLALIV
jgi:predicted RNase H-like HicB family nuclease